MELVNEPLDLASLDGGCIQGCRVDLGVDILDKEDGRCMPAPFFIGEFVPLQVGHECRVDHHVRPAALPPFLGIIEHIAFLVRPEIAHVNVVDLRHLPGKIPDHLQGKPSVDLKVLGDVLDLFPDGVTPPVHLLVGELRLQGSDGHLVPGYIVNVPVDDRPQGGYIVVQFQEIVRIGVPRPPFHHVPTGIDPLRW